MDIADRIEEGLRRFSALILEDAGLRAEFEASIAEFFGGPLPVGPAGDPRETLQAARRHVEWFVLERHSTTLFKTPVEALREPWRERAPDQLAELESAFLDSFTGVFRVTSVVPGEGAWLRDLAGFGEHPVLSPTPAAGGGVGAVLEEGDVVAGRLFPVPGKGSHVSEAAAVFRDPGLLQAIERDLERAREQHGGSRVLHVSQRELERMFWRGAFASVSDRATEAAPASEANVAPDAVAAARQFLVDGGLAPAVVEGLLGRLAARPFDASKFAHGAGDVLGEILDEFAFETTIDLTRARELLTLAWAALDAPAPPISGPRAATGSQVPGGPRSGSGADTVRGAVDAFEQGRRAGHDLEGLFDALERDLGLAGGDGEDEEATPAPDFPGVVSAMVEEFLWELESVRGEPELRERYEVLRALGRFGAGIGVFESLSAQDLLRFSAFWLTERRELRDAAAARDMLEALDAFCEWAENAHELKLKQEFGATLEKLRSSLPRIVEANETLAPDVQGAQPDGTAAGEDVGELYEVVAPSTDAEWRLRDRGGREHHARPPGVLVPMVQAGVVRAGDRLRGRIEVDGRAVVYRMYPPEAAGLLA